MLAFIHTNPSAFADYNSAIIESLLLDLPKARYSSINASENYIITREAAMRILRVTQHKDHRAILDELIHWNLMCIEEQKLRNSYGDEFIEISPSMTLSHGFIAISIHRASDTESVYLTVYHDSEHVMMDIQIPDQIN